MRNLKRITYNVNKIQAWIDWSRISFNASLRGYDFTSLIPSKNASIFQIDKRIKALRHAITGYECVLENGKWILYSPVDPLMVVDYQTAMMINFLDIDDKEINRMIKKSFGKYDNLDNGLGLKA